MESGIKNFRDLLIWQKGKTVAIEIYRATEKFPPSEMFGLKSQMRRAAVSIASNIAEGFNRHHTNEYRQFLYIALGSCAELETQLEISHELGYIKNEHLKSFLSEIEHQSRMLRSLIGKLKN
jgi:four helix bundle protein